MRAVASATQTAEFAAHWQGQVVDGKFPLDQYLGGSDGQAVFITRMPGGPDRTAIKLVRVSACDPEAQLAAWRTAAKLSHPHLIRIFECGRCWLAGQDLVFVVTEFAEENLGLVLPQRALTPSEAESMLQPVVDALGYLHRLGLVHGHIRASNVMAIAEQVKLSSDGIQSPGAPVRALEESVCDAPELAARQLSKSADIWSLGKLVLEALTQRTDARVASLPQPFSDIVKHSTVREPALRWKIADVSARLDGRATGHQLTVADTRSVAVTTKSRKQIWIAIALALIVISAALVFRHRTATAPQPAQLTSQSEIPSTAESAPTQRADSPGHVLERVLPQPPRSALNTIHGHIKVRTRVAVDETGRVSSVSFASRGPSEYFARLAMQAANEWKFAPKIRNAQAVPSEWNVLFTYSRAGVQASEQAGR